jgi:hypothetical protein
MSQSSGMLDYCKVILTRVSFDLQLFEKELKKAIRMLVGNEVLELRQWCYSTFNGQFSSVLNNCFGNN